MTADVSVEKFGTVPLFEGLQQAEIMTVLKICENVSANPGDEIIKQGTPGDGIYVIAAGAFEVVKSGTEKKVLARLEEFSFFGEMSVVSSASRAASVVCVAAGRMKKISADKFNQLLDGGDLTAHKVVRNIARILAQRLASVEERLVG